MKWYSCTNGLDEEAIPRNRPQLDLQLSLISYKFMVSCSKLHILSRSFNDFKSEYTRNESWFNVQNEVEFSSGTYRPIYSFHSSCLKLELENEHLPPR